MFWTDWKKIFHKTNNVQVPLTPLLYLVFLMPSAIFAEEVLSIITEFTAPSSCYVMEADNTYPCIVTFKRNTYFVWCDSTRRPWVTKITENSAISIPLDTLSDFKARDDGHHKFSLGVDASGYLHITGDMHNYPGSNTDHLPDRYKNQSIMYWKSNKPEEITSGFSFYGAPGNLQKIPGVTFSYGGFYSDNNGELYYLCRSRAVCSNPPSHFAGEMGVTLCKYNTSQQQWIALGGLAPQIKPGAEYFNSILWEDNGHKGTGGWYQGFRGTICFDHKNRLHFACPINNDTTIDGPSDIVYACSDNGGITWERADGTLISQLPMRVEPGLSQIDIVEHFSDTIPYDLFAGVCVDKEGTPAVIFNTNGSKSNGVFRYWTGSAWSLPENDPSGLYIRSMAHLGPDGVINFFSSTGLYRTTNFGQNATKLGIKGYKNLTSIDVRGLRETGSIRCVGITTDNKMNLVKITSAAAAEIRENANSHDRMKVRFFDISTSKFNHFLEKNTTIRVNIFDMNGRLLFSKSGYSRSDGVHGVCIPFNQFSAGMYIVNFDASGDKGTMLRLKQN